MKLNRIIFFFGTHFFIAHKRIQSVQCLLHASIFFREPTNSQTPLAFDSRNQNFFTSHLRPNSRKIFFFLMEKSFFLRSDINLLNEIQRLFFRVTFCVSWRPKVAAFFYFAPSASQNRRNFFFLALFFSERLQRPKSASVVFPIMKRKKKFLTQKVSNFFFAFQSKIIQVSWTHIVLRSVSHCVFSNLAHVPGLT